MRCGDSKLGKEKRQNYLWLKNSTKKPVTYRSHEFKFNVLRIFTLS